MLGCTCFPVRRKLFVPLLSMHALTGDPVSEFLVTGEARARPTTSLEAGLGKSHWGEGGEFPSPVVPSRCGRFGGTPRVLPVPTYSDFAIFPFN